MLREGDVRVDDENDVDFGSFGLEVGDDAGVGSWREDGCVLVNESREEGGVGVGEEVGVGLEGEDEDGGWLLAAGRHG